MKTLINRIRQYLPSGKMVQTCPRRMSDFGPWDREEGLDTWRRTGGDLVCSFCGSHKPENALALLERYVNGESDIHFDYSPNKGKIYVSRPEVSNAMQGGIKFYLVHLDGYEREYVDRFLEVANKAAGLLHKRIEEMRRVQ